VGEEQLLELWKVELNRLRDSMVEIHRTLKWLLMMMALVAAEVGIQIALP
jgi:hypothetical protein